MVVVGWFDTYRYLCLLPRTIIIIDKYNLPGCYHYSCRESNQVIYLRFCLQYAIVIYLTYSMMNVTL